MIYQETNKKAINVSCYQPCCLRIDKCLVSCQGCDNCFPLNEL